MTVSAALEPDRLRAELVRPGSPWREVEHSTSIGSTNARAAELGRPWVVVAADHQSAGRGRLGRRWEAPVGASVAVSATISAPAGHALGWVPLLTGVAVAEAVEETTGLDTRLKWPNDVLLPADADRKVCGILCEVVSGPDGSIVVVGAGVNVGQDREQLPVATATSLALAQGREGRGTPSGEVDRTALVVAYLRRLAALTSDGLVGGAAEPSDAAEAEARYRRRCSTIGHRVRLSQPDGPDIVGLAVDVDSQGRLVIEAAGGRRAWAAGDVVHVRAADGDRLGP